MLGASGGPHIAGVALSGRLRRMDRDIWGLSECGATGKLKATRNLGFLLRGVPRHSEGLSYMFDEMRAVITKAIVHRDVDITDEEKVVTGEIARR